MCVFSGEYSRLRTAQNVSEGSECAGYGEYDEVCVRMRVSSESWSTSESGSGGVLRERSIIITKSINLPPAVPV